MKIWQAPGRSWFVAHSQLAAHSCQDAGGPEFDTGQNLTAMGRPLSTHPFPLCMVRRYNLQFVHTKILKCSQICARVEPPGTFVNMHKKEWLLTPLLVFLVWRYAQSWRENETACDNRNNPIFPQDDDRVVQCQIVSFVQYFRNLDT